MLKNYGEIFIIKINVFEKKKGNNWSYQYIAQLAVNRLLGIYFVLIRITGICQFYTNINPNAGSTWIPFVLVTK